MMKVQLKEKRWIAMAVMVLIWLLAFPLIASAANTSGYWEYTVSNQKATITAYNGEEAEVVIPEFIDGYRVVAIDSYVFENKGNMTSVTIPRYVESIGYHAFAGCEYLEEINFKAINCTYAHVNGETFLNAGKYSGAITVTIADGVVQIPERLFYAGVDTAYPRITNVSIPDSVEIIGDYAFSGCNDLEEISWGNGIRNIGNYAFRNCTMLKSVTIPSAVESIGYEAFADCEYLEEIYFNAVNCADANANGGTFPNAGKYSGTLEVIVADGVQRIPAYLFYGSSGDYPRITSVSISDSVKSIEKSAFLRCYNISSVTILNDTIKISPNAFEDVPTSAVFTCYYSSAADAFALSNNYDVKYLPPYTPENLRATGDSTSIMLSWDTARGAQGYQLYRKTDSTEWEKVYSGIGTIYEDTDISCGQTYYYTVAAYAPNVVGERSDSVSITYNGNSSIGGSTGGGSSTGGSSTGGGSSSGGSSGGGGGCYVATAVYGSYDCPEVWTLRRYRDYELSQTASGRAFIKTYYAVSPTIVKYFGEEEWFQDMWRGPLDKMVSDLQEKGYEATPYEDIEW